MLSRLALTATFATLLSYSIAAPVQGLDGQDINGRRPVNIGWIKRTPGGDGEAYPGVYCLNVNLPGFSSKTIGMEVFAPDTYSTCVDGDPGTVDVFGHPADVTLFYYNLGATQIKVQDTTTGEVSCVDFGNSTGAPITIATCDANAPGQKQFITRDRHIPVENRPGQCMEVVAESRIQPVRPYGLFKSVQSAECSTLDENQIFNFGGPPTPPVSGRPEPASPVITGRPLLWRSDSGQDICLQVNNGVLENGQSVGVGPCSAEPSVFQAWIFALGSTSIQVAPNDLTETPVCLDFGENLGTNGQDMKIWQCYQGAPQQSLFITEDNHIAVENGPG